MKKLLVVLFIFCASNALAQDMDLSLMTDMWDRINLLTSRQDPKTGKIKVFFPPDLASLNNKVIELPGYMLPIKAGLIHSNFMLSVLPVLQCQFCGQGDVPPLVEIQLLKGYKYSEKPIVIKGTLVLNNTDLNKSEISLVNATAVEFK